MASAGRSSFPRSRPTSASSSWTTSPGCAGGTPSGSGWISTSPTRGSPSSWSSRAGSTSSDLPRPTSRRSRPASRTGSGTSRASAARRSTSGSRSTRSTRRTAWKLRDNLTLHYGLRYEAQIQPQPDAPNPELAGSDRIPSDTNNFAPRVGLSWDPWKDGRGVVRANAGLFYARTTALPLVAPFTSNGIAQLQLFFLPFFPGAPTLSGRPGGAAARRRGAAHRRERGGRRLPEPADVPGELGSRARGAAGAGARGGRRPCPHESASQDPGHEPGAVLGPGSGRSPRLRRPAARSTVHSAS